MLITYAAAGLSMIDASTEEVSINLVLYNGQLGMLSVCTVHFAIDEAGRIETKVEVKSVKELKMKDELQNPLYASERLI